MEKLTARQAQILEHIRQHLADTGYPPTRMDIAATFGFRSPNAAEEHLRALAKKGVIRMIPGASRGIQLVEDESVQAGIPIVGQVAAGNPVLAQENIQGYCEIPRSFFSPDADYFLKVKGLSMKDAGILDGDLLAVHKTQDVRKGQIVVARLGDDVTVKRFDRKRNTIYLMPENPDFEVIEVDARDEGFAIEGLGVGVIRKDGI